MLRCKDCEHWTPGDGLHGDCSSPGFIPGYAAPRNAGPDTVRVENDEGWGFQTGPEFGCVHSEPRHPKR